MLNYCFGIYLQELHWDLRGLDIHLIWSIRGKTSPSRFNWPRNYPLFSVQFISMVFQANSEADLLEASSEAEQLEAGWEDFLNILLVLPVVLPDSWWVVTHPDIPNRWTWSQRPEAGFSNHPFDYKIQRVWRSLICCCCDTIARLRHGLLYKLSMGVMADEVTFKPCNYFSIGSCLPFSLPRQHQNPKPREPVWDKDLRILFIY